VQDPADAISSEDDLRARAIRAAKQKREFRHHLTTYVLVNLLLVGIWAATGADYFWPIWPILGWGIGIGFHAWGVYGAQRPLTEDEISREMDRLRR
jgi:hypothetical protein